MTPAQDPATQVTSGEAASTFLLPPDKGACCAHCAASVSQQFVYSLGRISVRFPTLAIEREFQQRERHLYGGDAKKELSRSARVADVLAANDHLARTVCFIHSIGGLPAYIVAPSGVRTLEVLIEAIRHQDREDGWDLLIGRRGPMATPMTCAGLLAPIVLCDALYSFTLGEFLSELGKRLIRHSTPPEFLKTVSNELHATFFAA